MSYRKSAKRSGGAYSHTLLREMTVLLVEAEARGVEPEFTRRIMDGEKRCRVLADLMPDVLEAQKWRQNTNQLRCMVRYFLCAGISADQLCSFIVDIEDSLFRERVRSTISEARS